jgi:hypothetical protein
MFGSHTQTAIGTVEVYRSLKAAVPFRPRLCTESRGASIAPLTMASCNISVEEPFALERTYKHICISSNSVHLLFANEQSAIVAHPPAGVGRLGRAIAAIATVWARGANDVVRDHGSRRSSQEESWWQGPWLFLLIVVSIIFGFLAR